MNVLHYVCLINYWNASRETDDELRFFIVIFIVMCKGECTIRVNVFTSVLWLHMSVESNLFSSNAL